MSYSYSNDGKTLTSLPNGVTHMIIQPNVEILGSDCTKESADSLEKVSFLTPSSLKNLLHNTFRGCVHLREVDFRNCTQLVSFLSHNFNGCSSLERVYFPDSFLYFDTTVFVGTALKSFTLTKGFDRIGTGDFIDVLTLETVDFSNAINLRSIGMNCFQNSGVRIIDMSKCKKLTLICSGAFKDCKQLTRVIFPCNNNKIMAQDNCFSNCSIFLKIFISKCYKCAPIILPKGVSKHFLTCKPRSNYFSKSNKFIFIILIFTK